MSNSAINLDQQNDEFNFEQSGKFKLGHLDRLAIILKRWPALVALGLFCLACSTGAALVEPRIFGWAIDHAIVERTESLGFYVALLIAVILTRTGLGAAQSYCFEILGSRVVKDLRRELFAHLQRLPLAVFDRNPAGRLLTRVTNDVSSVGEMFSMGLVSVLGNITVALGILIALMLLNPRLGFISLSIFPFLVALTVLFSARLSKAYRISRSRLSTVNAYLAENFLGMRLLQLFNREPIHLARYREINQAYTDAQINTVKTFALFQPLITLSTGISMALAIAFGGRAVLRGEMTPGTLVAFFSYVLALFQPVREIADKWNIFLSGMASAERIFQILDEGDAGGYTWAVERESGTRGRKSSEGPHGGDEPRLEFKGHIRFENIWFAYVESQWVLQDFSLEIDAGQTVGIVGHTGSGKSTLIQLLLRFYEPQRGRILIDGRDIREFDRAALRRSFGLIQQDVFVFAGSFSDNVTLFDQTAEIRDVSPQAGNSNKADEEILERGANLSMGQRQMLAFERARHNRPRIWILDEASANLDSSSEAELRQALADSARGQTQLIVAHRLSTIRSADQIIVLHKGELLEKGTHAELIRKDGLYARLQQLDVD